MKYEAEEIEKIKIESIIDMAVSFSAMTRVFEKGSAGTIRKEIVRRIDGFLGLNSKEEYDKKHDDFCEWFTKNIKTAERNKDGTIIKRSQCSSWGQAAKVIDIVMKVFFYYCRLPSDSYASKIIPCLNGAIDSKIIGYLKKEIKEGHLMEYKEAYYPRISKISNIGKIDKKEKYYMLQKLFRLDLEKSGNKGISLVEYEDVTWRKLRDNDK